MRRIVAVSLTLALVFTVAGCLLNRYSSDPNERIAQLQPVGAAAGSPEATAPPAIRGTHTGNTASAASDPLELRKSLAEKKARYHQTQAQFYNLEAQRYAAQKALRDLEAQIAAAEKALAGALKEKRAKRKAAGESGPGTSPEKAAPPTGQQGTTTPPLSSRFWGAVDRMQSFLGVRVVNVYSSDPNRRIVELLDNSEDLRRIEYEWERIWFTDHPSHLTPERVDGATPP